MTELGRALADENATEELGAAVARALIAGVVIYLDAVVQEKFSGKRWAVPAKVYARPLELFAGQRLNKDDFLAELEALGYRTAQSARSPGQVSVAGNRVDVHTRGFAFSEGDEPAQHVSVVAHRSEQRLEPLDTALWGRPFVLAAGPVNVAAMPAVDRVSERSGRMSATWPVRVLVFGTFWLGLYLLLWPLRSFVKPLPLLGRLTSGALWLGSLLTAAVLTSVTVLLVRLLAQL